MRTTSRITRLSAVGLSLALFLAACGGDDDSADTTDDTIEAPDATGDEGGTGDEGEETTGDEPEAVAPEDNGGRTDGDGTLTIGVVLPQSGQLAELGPAMIAGARMAERDINEAGGVLDSDVELIVRDDGGGANDDLAITSVEELINNDNVDGIVGAAASGTSLAILDRVTSSGTVQCSPSNTGSNLTGADDRGLYFRTPPVDNLQAQALAQAITEDGHENVAVVAQNTDYGTGFVRFLAPALSDAGVEVVADVTYDPEGTGIDTEVQQVVSAEPDAVALIGYPEDGGRVLAEMARQGAGPDAVAIYVADGMASNELYTNVDESDEASTEGILGTAPSAAPEGGASFFPDAFAEFDPSVSSPIYSAQAYDCVMLMALSAMKAESDAPYDIALEMINVSGGESDDAEACETFEDCVSLLDEGTDINYEGASGAGDFNEFGEPSAGEYEVFEFGADGTYEEINRVVVED
jgi:ABC-type branched-subunit amino acid transport system substrate-binding protein